MSEGADVRRAVFVTHGGPTIGLGHLRRCLAFGRGLAAEGVDVAFLVSPDPRVEEVVRRHAFSVWPVAWEADPDALRARAVALAPDAVIVDSYAVTPRVLTALSTVARRVVAVDDLADRPLPVQVVINGGIAAERLAYQVPADTVLLRGPRFALIDPDYSAPPPPRDGDGVRRILLSLGGGRSSGVTATALSVIAGLAPAAILDVVVGPFGERDPLAATPDLLPMVVHRNPSRLAELMLAADLAVAGGGLTLYELAAAATPTVVIEMASNQSLNAKGFADAGAAVFGGRADEPDLAHTLAGAIRAMLEDPPRRARLARKARSLIDGHGVRRATRVVRQRGWPAAAVAC